MNQPEVTNKLFAETMAKSSGLLRNEAHKLYTSLKNISNMRYMDEDDYYQLLCLRVYEACRHFNPTKNVKLFTYVKTVLDNKVKYIRNHSRNFSNTMRIKSLSRDWASYKYNDSDHTNLVLEPIDKIYHYYPAYTKGTNHACR